MFLDMNKRIFSLITAFLAVLMCVTSCAGSDPNAQIVGECGGYEVKYEELRYLTMTCKAELAEKYGEEIFAAESSVYTGDYALELEEMVKEQICQNYASLKAFNDSKIKTNQSETKQYVRQYMSAIMSEYDSEEEFLADLEACYMTENVLSYNAALESCFVRYCEKMANELSEESYDAVMDGSSFIRVMSIFIQNDKGENVEKNRGDAEKVRAEIASGTPLREYIGTKYNQDTGTCDYYVCRGYFDEAYEDAAFALEIGEVSQVIETEAGFYIIERMEPSATYMLGNIASLQQMYIESKVYEKINAALKELEFEFNDYGKSLNLWTME